jgi:hypothetical protein
MDSGTFAFREVEVKMTLSQEFDSGDNDIITVEFTTSFDGSFVELTLEEDDIDSLIFVETEYGNFEIEVIPFGFTTDPDQMEIVINDPANNLINRFVQVEETAPESLVFSNGDRGPRLDLPPKSPLATFFQIASYDPDTNSTISGSLESSVELMQIDLDEGTDGIHRSMPILGIYHDILVGDYPSTPGLAFDILRMNPDVASSSKGIVSWLKAWFNGEETTNKATKGPLLVKGSAPSGIVTAGSGQYKKWGKKLKKSFGYKDYTYREAPRLTELIELMGKSEVFIFGGH